MNYLKLAVTVICIFFIFISVGISLYKAHQGKSSQGTLTFFLCLIILGLLDLNENKNIKINGSELSIEIKEQQAKDLSRVEESLEKNDLEGAKKSFYDFKSQIINSREFPGVAVNLLSHMTFQKYIDLKKSKVREVEKIEEAIKKDVSLENSSE